MTKACGTLFMTLFLSLSLAAQKATPKNLGQSDPKLNFAATQHEIIQILLTEGRYDQVLVEFQKILDLNFTGEGERLVIQEAWQIIERLLQVQQYALAHQIVDATLARTEGKENRFSLLMFKGKILKDEGRLSEALEVYREAQRLQE